jgi:hypothetical protein
MQRKRLRRPLTAVIALALAAVALPAHAAFVDDPAQARGPLDLRRLVANKHDATAPIHLSIVTYGSWRARLLDQDGPNRLFVLFNPYRTEDEAFIGEIMFRDERLWMRVTRRNGTFIRWIPAHHPTGSIVRVTVPRGLPNPDGHSWLAAKEQFTTAAGDCAETCRDRIPDGGWLKLTPGQ